MQLVRLGILILLLVPCLALAGQPVIHGIVSQGYLKSTDYNYLAATKDGTFQFNEVLINASAKVSPKLRVGAQLMSRNLGQAGNEDFALDWAFADYRVRDQIGLRIGKIKTPHGLYNTTRDVDMVRNSILLPQVVYTEVMRDVMNGFEGASIYGSLSLADNFSLSYEGFYGTVDVERTLFPVDMIVLPVMQNVYGAPLPYYDWKAKVEHIYGGNLQLFPPIDGLRLGASAFEAKMEGTGLFTGPGLAFTPVFMMEAAPWWVLSAEYSRDNLVAVFEFTRAMIEMELRDLATPMGPMTIPMEDRRGGWYGQVTYRATDLLELGAYYSQFYPNYMVRDGDGPAYQQKDIALTARMDITDYWLIKAELHFMTGNGQVRPELNRGADFAIDDWKLFGIKSTFFF
jgi:hypothetical protein